MQSATERRDLRRSIRNGLGVSGDEAPDGVRALRAAQAMARLVELATDGRYRLILDDTQSESTTWHGAVNVARGLTPGGTRRDA